MLRRCAIILGVLSFLLPVAIAQANVFNMGGTRNPVTGTWTDLASLEFVTVGDPGNTPSTYFYSATGSVAYSYQIGKYEVTAGQYCQFLNAVAKSDPYDLYSPYMDSSSLGCQITRHGTSGSYWYDFDGRPSGTVSDWGNRPVNLITWGRAARFCNWLHNGQPVGDEGAGTTESGAYTLNGATTDSELSQVTRNPGAQYFIPSENEWFKAAYYKGGGTNTGYWHYATKSDSMPESVLSATGANNANIPDLDYMIGAPYYRTDVGAFASSPSPYGTYDQAGNVKEWNEKITADGWRGLSGGSFGDSIDSGGWAIPSYLSSTVGFRVASVPEPGGLMILLAGAISLLCYGWRRRGLCR